MLNFNNFLFLIYALFTCRHYSIPYFQVETRKPLTTLFDYFHKKLVFIL